MLTTKAAQKTSTARRHHRGAGHGPVQNIDCPINHLLTRRKGAPNVARASGPPPEMCTAADLSAPVGHAHRIRIAAERAAASTKEAATTMMSQTEEPQAPSKPKRTRREPSRQDKIAERRLSLLEAALRVIARKGLVGATMNDIASEAGCAYGVVAFHFKSKDGIMLAALDYMVEEYDRTLELPKFQTPEARLKAMINLDFDPRISDNGRIAVFTAFWAESARNPEYRKRCAELKSRYHDATVADIAELARRHGMKLDANLVARSLNALIDGLWIAGQVLETTDASGRRSARKACEFYLRSIFPESF